MSTPIYEFRPVFDEDRMTRTDKLKQEYYRLVDSLKGLLIHEQTPIIEKMQELASQIKGPRFRVQQPDTCLIDEFDEFPDALQRFAELRREGKWPYIIDQTPAATKWCAVSYHLTLPKQMVIGGYC